MVSFVFCFVAFSLTACVDFEAVPLSFACSAEVVICL